MASQTGMFVTTPVESPRSSAYSRMVFKVRAGWPLTAGSSESMPLFVFSPVTMAVMPAAESVTQRSSDEVSDSARCGKLCR